MMVGKQRKKHLIADLDFIFKIQIQKSYRIKSIEDILIEF
jgi:tRNA A-37 threonylcarbamoyl transferase component Bud32